MKLGHVLEVKDRKSKRQLVTTSGDTTLLDAIRLLCEHLIGCLLVVDEKQHLVGIVSERDILQSCCSDHTALGNVTVGDVMARDLLIGHPGDGVEDALHAMTSRRIRHLPMVQDDKIIGVLSLGDILRQLYSQDEIKIRDMSDYLGGTYGLKVY